MDYKEILTKDISGLPVWVWLLVILAGLGISVLINKRSAKKEENSDNEHKSNSAQVNDNYPIGDSAEGGMPIMASQTNTSLPYAGLPADTYTLINQGGLSGIPPEMLIGNQYPWRFSNGRWKNDMDRHRNRHKHTHEHNIEGHGSTVASRVGSR